MFLRSARRHEVALALPQACDRNRFTCSNSPLNSVPRVRLRSLGTPTRRLCVVETTSMAHLLSRGWLPGDSRGCHSRPVAWGLTRVSPSSGRPVASPQMRASPDLLEVQVVAQETLDQDKSPRRQPFRRADALRSCFRRRLSSATSFCSHFVSAELRGPARACTSACVQSRNFNFLQFFYAVTRTHSHWRRWKVALGLGGLGLSYSHFLLHDPAPPTKTKMFIIVSSDHREVASSPYSQNKRRPHLTRTRECP